MKNDFEKLKKRYSSLSTTAVNKYMDNVFNHFNQREEEIKKLIAIKLKFSALLNVCNGIDALSQFYKGVIKNKDNGVNKVPNHNDCDCKYKKCIFNSKVYFKTRSHGSGNKTMHLSSNGRWEPVVVGETYQIFLKNNDKFFKHLVGNDPKRTIAQLVYKMRNDIDHSGFLELLGYKIIIQNNNQLFVEKGGIKINLFEKFQNMLTNYKKSLQNDLEKHRKDERPNIYKTSRVIRFMDRCLYLKVNIN